MCFSKWGILCKVCKIKRSTEVIRTQWQNFLQDPRSTIITLLHFGQMYLSLTLFFIKFHITFPKLVRCFARAQDVNMHLHGFSKYMGKLQPAVSHLSTYSSTWTIDNGPLIGFP